MTTILGALTAHPSFEPMILLGTSQFGLVATDFSCVLPNPTKSSSISQTELRHSFQLAIIPDKSAET